MVERDLKIRYKNSILGFFWSFINPIVTMLVLFFVFKVVMRSTIPNFTANMLAALLPYTFFQQAVLDSAHSIISGMSIMKKVYFPREIYPLSNIIANFIHLVAGLAMFFVFLVAIYARSYFVDPKTAVFALSHHVWLLPFLLVINFMMVTGFGLLAAAYNTIYEDVKYLLTIFFQILFYLCPIIYVAEQVRYSGPIPEKYKTQFYNLYMMNPFAEMVHAYRRALIEPTPWFDPETKQSYIVGIGSGKLAILAVFSVFIMWFGYRQFNKIKWTFMERP